MISIITRCSVLSKIVRQTAINRFTSIPILRAWIIQKRSFRRIRFCLLSIYRIRSFYLSTRPDRLIKTVSTCYCLLTSEFERVGIPGKDRGAAPWVMCPKQTYEWPVRYLDVEKVGIGNELIRHARMPIGVSGKREISRRSRVRTNFYPSVVSYIFAFRAR